MPSIKKSPQYDCLLIGIGLPNERLKTKITKRIDNMLKQGLEKEVRKLSNKYGFNTVLKDSIDYAEWQGYPKNKSLVMVKEEIKRNHLKLVKHQTTWFKRDKRIHRITTQKQAEHLVKNFLNK